MSEQLSKPRGAFPHLRVAGSLVFVSGTSSRQPDNTFAGATADKMGTVTVDIAAQTRAVLENVETILRTIGLERTDIVDVTSFLVNMNDFGPYNDEWALFFGDNAPARTTVAVHQLPHPHLVIEMKATALMRS